MRVTKIAQTKEIPKILRLAPYGRVSSDSEDQIHSFAAQIRYYTDYVKKHPEFELVDIYADEGITGRSVEKRDEFNRLLRDCKKGKIDRIITKSVSRFARNTTDLLITLRMLKELGISVYFEEQGIDTDKMNMEMIVTFPGMIAQQESDSISGNMKWSYKKRMESGSFNTCYPAYGYMLKNGTLSVNEEEAAVVRHIFDLYLQGAGIASIANTLNTEGIISRNADKLWHHTGILYILKNERYIGDALLQKSYTTTTAPFAKKKNHGEVTQYYVENSQPPIISREMYQAVKELMAQRKFAPSRFGRSPFSKKIYCSQCGHTYRRQTVNGTVYWICSYRSSGYTQCSSSRVHEDEIRTVFTLMVKKLSANREMLFGTLIRQLETMQSKSGDSQQKVYQIDKEIADYCAKNLVITRLHNKGILNAAEYAAQSSEITNKISALRVERRKKIAEDEDCELIEKLKDLGALLADVDIETDFDEGLFSLTVERIMVIDSGTLEFKLTGGITLTEKISGKGTKST